MSRQVNEFLRTALERAVHDPGNRTGFSTAFGPAVSARWLGTVYVAPHAVTPEGQEYRERRLVGGTGVAEEVATHPRAILVGESGSGKSFFARVLCACLSGERLGSEHLHLTRLSRPSPLPAGFGESGEANAREGDPPARLWPQDTITPLLIELDSAAAARELLGSVPAEQLRHALVSLAAEQYGTTVDALEQTLIGASVMLVLDGIDRLQPAGNAARCLARNLAELAAALPDWRFLVTCRYRPFYTQIFSVEDFQVVHLSAFQPEQVESYVERRLALHAEEGGAATVGLDELMDEIRSAPGLGELLSNPLHLALWTGLRLRGAQPASPTRASIHAAWGERMSSEAASTHEFLEDDRKPGLVQRLELTLTSHALPAVERIDAGRALARLGDTRAGVGLGEDGLPDLTWCAVPCGPFVMGCDFGDHEVVTPGETPRHELDCDAFDISRYPVTNVQFESFVRQGGYRDPALWSEAAEFGYWSTQGFRGRFDDAARRTPAATGYPYDLGNHPVVGVSWFEAIAFCRWLTVALRSAGQLESPERRVSLPTEAQWAKAARGTDGRLFPWGAEFDADLCNCWTTGVTTSSPVGAFPRGASPHGVEDLAGNVFEWCSTRWGGGHVWDSGIKYPYRADEREDTAIEDTRVLRGGSFRYESWYVKATSRGRSYPDYWRRDRGFRVVIASTTPST